MTSSDPVSERISVVQGDITRQETEAIVNAANTSLLGGGGVDGAIHRAAGPGLLEECRAIRAATGGCPTGEARITGGHQLAAKWVIHTVGPVWQGGGHGEDELLACAYRNSLRLAAERGIRTIAFPSISTGAYGFPLARAARIALGQIRQHLRDNELPERVTMVCFGEDVLQCYLTALRESE